MTSDMVQFTWHTADHSVYKIHVDLFQTVLDHIFQIIPLFSSHILDLLVSTRNFDWAKLWHSWRVINFFKENHIFFPQVCDHSVGVMR